MNKKLLSNLQDKHLFDTELKRKNLGEGEWVNEADEIIFEYNGYRCQIHRIFVREPYTKEEAWFGGHLCGYVYIPSEHVYFQKDYNDMEIECHGGLTYSDFDDKGQYKIGFDCAHLGDYTPSTEHLKNTLPELMEIKKEYEYLKKGIEDHWLFNTKYRNIEFCMSECCSIVDQLIEVKCQEKE